MQASRRQFLSGNFSGRGMSAHDPQARPEIGAACLALRQVVCRSCGDACEVRAIRFKLRPGGVAVPELDPAACTGCGACRGTCPVRAIAMRHTESEVTA
jgi:ferredoxin-type protein NapF